MEYETQRDVDVGDTKTVREQGLTQITHDGLLDCCDKAGRMIEEDM